MDRERTDDDREPAPAKESPFRRLPPRVTPEQMIETRAVVHTVSTALGETDTERMLRNAG